MPPGEYDCDDYGLDLGYNHLNTTGVSQTLFDFLAIKDPDWQLSQAVEEMVTGDIGGYLILVIVKRKLPFHLMLSRERLLLTFAPQPYPDYFTGYFAFANNSFELTAQGSLENPITSFAEPITIKIHYNDEDLQGVPEENLALYYWDEDVNWWADVVTSCEGGFYTRNFDENWLSITVCHLSDFALLGKRVINLNLPVDINPTSCRNPLNVKDKGVMTVAILGTEEFDVTQFDPATVTLLDVYPLRWSYEDVATPYEPYVGKADAFDCTTEGADGYLDLVFHFDMQEIVAQLGDVNDGDILVLSLTSNRLEEFGCTLIVGEDVVVILKKGK